MIRIRAAGALTAVIAMFSAIEVQPAASQVAPMTGDRNAQAARQKLHVEAFVARTQLPKSAVVSVKPDIVIGFRAAKSSWSPSEKIGLQGEVVDDEAALRLGYRSMRSIVEVNCESRRDRVVEMEVFSLPNLKGEKQVRTLPGGWVQPSDDAFMADVVRAVCNSRIQVPTLRPIVTDQPAKKPQPEEKATATTPIVVSTDEPKSADSSKTITVQVGSLDSEVAANNALKKYRVLGGAVRSTRIEVAQLGPRTYYRALVQGFSTRQEAQAYCVEVQRQHGPCLVRQSKTAN